MTFSVDDYEKAITRIFLFDSQGKKHVIGTGFLVAPGYILTCAHVVLQAIGISKENYSAYQGQPQEAISLDFHVLATGKPISADVVGWLPYSLDEGDIAALKLREPEPEGAKPIPLVEVSRAEIENEAHSVYGFGNSDYGGRSDAYRPKTQVAGGRFQLCKFDDPDDETIKGGFSGAPLWNEVKKSVIGMVATAQEKKTIAYAIPTHELRPVLKQIDALCLNDILTHSLEVCGSDDEQYRLKSAIDRALRHCNPRGGDRLWQKQIEDLGVDRADTPGWETEGRLVQFAVMLAWMEDTPRHTYDRLKVWVERRNPNFSNLLDRLTREMKQQKISSSHVCQHLMVDVEQQGTSTDELRVSIWAVADSKNYNPNKPPPPLVSEKILSLKELPSFIRDQIRHRFRKKSIPLIHFFVPRQLFDCDIEMQPIGKLKAVLGGKYPFVVRTNLKSHPIGYFYYDDWNEKWQELMQLCTARTSDVLKSLDCSVSDWEVIEELTTIQAAILNNCQSVGEFFELISEETALPVALWSRNPKFQDNLADVLDCIVKTLPNRIQQERDKAHKSKIKQEQDTAHKSQIEMMLGHHLSLVWEDPEIVPPDMQFDPDAY